MDDFLAMVAVGVGVLGTMGWGRSAKGRRFLLPVQHGIDPFHQAKCRIKAFCIQLVPCGLDGICGAVVEETASSQLWVAVAIVIVHGDFREAIHEHSLETVRLKSPCLPHKIVHRPEVEGDGQAGSAVLSNMLMDLNCCHTCHIP